MKRFRLLSVIALAASVLACVSAAPTVAGAQASPAGAHTNVIVGTITEDVDVALPPHITVAEGTVILFIRKPSVGSDVSIQVFVGAAGDVIHMPAVSVGNAPPGYMVVNAFKVVGKGTVHVDVYHTYVIPNATPQKTGSMDITVQ